MPGREPARGYFGKATKLHQTETVLLTLSVAGKESVHVSNGVTAGVAVVSEASATLSSTPRPTDGAKVWRSLTHRA